MSGMLPNSFSRFVSSGQKDAHSASKVPFPRFAFQSCHSAKSTGTSALSTKVCGTSARPRSLRANARSSGIRPAVIPGGSVKACPCKSSSARRVTASILSLPPASSQAQNVTGSDQSTLCTPTPMPLAPLSSVRRTAVCHSSLSVPPLKPKGARSGSRMTPSSVLTIRSMALTRWWPAWPA